MNIKKLHRSHARETQRHYTDMIEEKCFYMFTVQGPPADDTIFRYRSLNL